jgi:hypothetical protein
MGRRVWFKIILWVWQLPQNLLGLLLVWSLKARRGILQGPGDNVYFTDVAGVGVSLGNYIILSSGCSLATLLHEWGHQKQSRWLGPLYLALVGIPSAVFCNLWDRLFHKKWDSEKRVAWYYSRWPEGPGGHWWDRFTADILGGVSARMRRSG